MKFVVQICILVIQIRTSVKKFSVYIIQIQIRVESIQIRHRSGQRLNWVTVLRTCCIFREFERHKFRFEWRQCKFECWENKIEWRIDCAWPKSSKLNAHKMNLVDKITKLTGKTYSIPNSFLMWKGHTYIVIWEPEGRYYFLTLFRYFFRVSEGCYHNI